MFTHLSQENTFWQHENLVGRSLAVSDTCLGERYSPEPAVGFAVMRAPSPSRELLACYNAKILFCFLSRRRAACSYCKRVASGGPLVRRTCKLTCGLVDKQELDFLNAKR